MNSMNSKVFDLIIYCRITFCSITLSHCRRSFWNAAIAKLQHNRRRYSPAQVFAFEMPRTSGRDRIESLNMTRICCRLWLRVSRFI